MGSSCLEARLRLRCPLQRAQARLQLLCSFAFVVLELGAALCSCFAFAVLELVRALHGAFLLLRPLGGGVALHDAGRGDNEAGFTLIVGLSIIVVEAFNS